MKENETPQAFRQRKNRAGQIVERLEGIFGGQLETELRYSNNFELLVCVILSAQCTDKQVNIVTAKLFQKYRTLNDYLAATQAEFEKDIYATGFYRNKAKNILAAARKIRDDFDGRVPDTMNELLELPGVARKTANVVLGNAYGIVEGIAVDTHVKRLTRLWGLTDEETPEKIEQDLMEILPQQKWFDFTYQVIEYGRKYCPARKRDHSDCPLKELEQK